MQPHAGAQANMAVFGAFLQPRSDDKVLGLVLAHGGHLTHGSPVNVSGMWFDFIGYEVDRETERLDYDRIRDLAREHRPKIVLAGYTAYPRVIDWAAFRDIADEVGAILWVDASHFIGLCAGDAYPSPVPFADVVTFTTHKTLRGPRGAIVLCREEHAKAIDKAVFPMMQGGPLEHVIAAKAVALKEAMAPDVPRVRGPHGADGARPRPGPRGRGRADRLGRDRLAPGPVRPPAARASAAGRPRRSATRSASRSTRT